MTRLKPPILCLLLVCAACGATSIQREMQVARGIITANDTAVQMLEFGVWDADDGDIVQATTRTVTKALSDAIKARRTGAPLTVYDALLVAAEEALLQAAQAIEKIERGK